MSFGPYCYSNNGLSFRSVTSDYVAQSGEVIFSDTPTTDQLTSAFTNFATYSQNQINLSKASIALSDSDLTMHRIAEAVSLGLTTWTTADVVAWVEYRRALRAIITAGSGTVPTVPSYPQGT